MGTGAKKEVKTERGQQGKDRRTGVGTKRDGTEGGMGRRMIEIHNKQLIPDGIKLFFH